MSKGIFFKGNLKEGNYTLIKTIDGWALNGEDIVYAGFDEDRPQGEWIDKGDYAVCSNCGAHSGVQYDGVEPVPLTTRYCHDCGCRMKGADDE